MNTFLTIEDLYYGFNLNALDIISIFSVLSGILVIISKNPIISVLFLIGLFLCISLYLILIGLSFIGLSYLLVYIGAVSILFLFILMLIDVRISELQSNTNNSLMLSFIIGIIFYNTLYKIIPFSNKDEDIHNFLEFLNPKIVSIVTSSNWEGSLAETIDIVNIGNVLYSNLSIWLIISSLILLLAMVGAIIININNKSTI